MNGKEFMKMLHDEHGLLEGCRLAKDDIEVVDVEEDEDWED